MSEEMTREQEKQEWIEVQEEVAQIQAKALLPIIEAFANTRLTLRQHYAGLALQGLLAAGCSPNHAAELALSSADELLAYLEPRT